MHKFVAMLLAAVLCSAIVGCKDESTEAPSSAPKKERSAADAQKF